MMPVFLIMTQTLDEKQRRAVVKRATVVAVLALLLFTVTGQFMFKFFGISSDGFRIVGGFIIFRIGLDMMQAKYTSMRAKKEEIKAYTQDISVTPLGIPMLCGPGAIANAIVLMEDAHTFEMKSIVVGVILLVYLLAYLILTTSSRLLNIIGETGNNVMMRLMGLILMVIAVECFVSGIRPILINILQAV